MPGGSGEGQARSGGPISEPSHRASKCSTTRTLKRFANPRSSIALRCGAALIRRTGLLAPSSPSSPLAIIWGRPPLSWALPRCPPRPSRSASRANRRPPHALITLNRAREGGRSRSSSAPRNRSRCPPISRGANARLESSVGAPGYSPRERRKKRAPRALKDRSTRHHTAEYPEDFGLAGPRHQRAFLRPERPQRARTRAVRGLNVRASEPVAGVPALVRQPCTRPAPTRSGTSTATDSASARQGVPPAVPGDAVKARPEAAGLSLSRPIVPPSAQQRAL